MYIWKYDEHDSLFKINPSVNWLINSESINQSKFIIIERHSYILAFDFFLLKY